LDAGAPVAHARIVLAKVGGTLADYRTTVADANGAFELPGLGPGTYRIHATRDGYLPAEFGRRASGQSGVPVEIYEGQVPSDVEIVMTPTGVITGHVSLRDEPLSHTIVRALKAAYVDGERQLSVAEWAETDDRGEYRLFGLAPGTYFVSATPRARARIEGTTLVTPVMATNGNGNRREERTPIKEENLSAAAFERSAIAPQFYPNTPTIEAALPVALTAGAVVAGIDFALAPSPPMRIRGMVAVVGVPNIDSIRVRVQPADIAYSLPSADKLPDSTGAFEFSGLPPGNYDVVALATSFATSGTTQYTKAIRVRAVDQEPPPVAIQVGPAISVLGRVTVDGKAIPTGVRAIGVQLRGTAVRGACCGAAFTASDGSFVINNVVPGEYRLRLVTPGRTFWTKSARFNGDDVRSSPLLISAESIPRELEIDLSSTSASIQALVTDSHQSPQPGVLVVAIPAADRRGFNSAFMSATTDAFGRAQIDGLPPGDYELFASASIGAGDWQDPAVLQRHVGTGTVVHATEGGRQAASVTILP
jgi:hypothetical protein